MAFAHLTLPTQDVEGTASFLERTMCWPRVAAPANTPIQTIWLQIATGQQIHVFHVEGFKVSPFEREFGRHLAVFHSADDFAALKRRLVENGAELIAPIRPTPFERFFFREPNGYVFEVIAREQFVTET